MGFVVDNNYPDSSHRYVMAGMRAPLVALALAGQTSGAITSAKNLSIRNFANSLLVFTQPQDSAYELDYRKGPNALVIPAHLLPHAIENRVRAQAVSEAKSAWHGFDVGSGGPAEPTAGGDVNANIKETTLGKLARSIRALYKSPSVHASRGWQAGGGYAKRKAIDDDLDL